MNSKLNNRERLHLARIKSLPCSVCDADTGSEAHHIDQGSTYTCVALCVECHRGPILGWHGQKRMWAIKKLDELGALNITIRRLLENPAQ
jgi:hypothetical protein